MDAIKREMIMQRWNVIQHELLPELRNDVGQLIGHLSRDGTSIEARERLAHAQRPQQ